MARVTWTEQALDDLDDVCMFIARDTRAYASVFAAQVFQAVERLGDFPRSGRIVPELDRDEVRELIVHSYRIIYRLIPDQVEILTVHHGARPLESSELSGSI